jgi:LmbE family N-acetylglucosaminyl deacetylase
MVLGEKVMKKHTMSFFLTLVILFFYSQSIAKILVVAPHPDDDIITAAGIIYQAVNSGEPIRIIYVTNGDKSGSGGPIIGYERQLEAVNAQVGHLGMIEDDLIFLGYPDGYLKELFDDYTEEDDSFTTPFGQSTTYGNRGLGRTDYHSYRFGSPAQYNKYNILLDLQDIISNFKPDHIFTVSEFDHHSDHSTTYELLKLAIFLVFENHPNYTPVIHKTIVWSGSSSWPEPTDPTSYFSKVPNLSQTNLSWDNRESIDVPLAMQSTNYSYNPKYLAVSEHQSQGGATGFLGLFIHKDEFFWTENLSGINQPPIANAGQNQTINEGIFTTLDGSGSSDPDGDPLTYQWEQEPGGSSVILSDSTVMKPTFTAPEVGLSGETLTFKLTITDAGGLESIDTTIVEVLNDDCPNDPNKTEPGVCGCGAPDLDTDGDGTLDCNDSCPNDPNKTGPDICGCGIADTDSDGNEIPDCNDNCDNFIDTDEDGTPDCNDNCPNDPYKTNPGICGCGVSEIDTDSDGTLDCNDNCPNDPSKSQPDVCGCGVPDVDTDGDGTLDCNDNCPNDPNKTGPDICGCGIADTDSDGDGISDCEEQGSGNDPYYDGNDDGIADSLQGNVASLNTYNNQDYVTVASPAGTTIRSCKAADNPSTTNSPSDIVFSYEFIEFSIEGVGIGGATTVTLYFPDGKTFDTYYKFGATPNNPTNHWYEFLYDGQTGARINGNVITLHLVDSKRGDDDLIANGIVFDVGAPAVAIKSSGRSPLTADSGGGGGCFIATAAYGSLVEPHVKILGDFRDRFLMTNILGKSFVNFYYKYSPPAADFIVRHHSLRAVVRMSLLPLVGASWVALRFGPTVTMAFILFFGAGLIAFLYFARKKIKN